MNTFFEKLKLVFKDSMLRKRVLFTLGALVVFRFLAVIPIPGIDAAKLEGFLAGNQFLGLLNIFSCGGLSNLSIVMLGVGPFITASIIMQLLTMMSPKLKEMYQEEGDAGRVKFAQYSRMLTVPLALIQSFAFIKILQSQGILLNLGTFDTFLNIMIITAGSLLLTWIGELVSEFGIGNGVSLIIFAGIISALPTSITQLYLAYDPSQIPMYVGVVVVAIAIIMGIVYVTEAERPIPVTYAKQVRGNKVYGGVSTYIPLRINQAGVIPIIFALSILLFPQMLLTFFTRVGNELVANLANKALYLLGNQWYYAVMYFMLVFIFTYFYTAVTFDPNKISTNLQKGGAFIPGVRPGESTSVYIAKILTRITLVGALFLGFVAVLPLFMKAVTGITNLAIGGTALLIVISVVLDLMKKINAQVSMREY
jgi:preprotein translocase subunit SecY